MIIFIGPPGAGKSLQASLVEERGAAKWISVGKALRASLSGELKEKMDEGELLDDATVTGVISEAVHAVPVEQKILLDGFPRKESQLDWLFTPDNPRQVIGVLNIELPDEEIMNRLSKRGRVDDDPETISHRIQLYKEEINPILEHFENLHVPVIQVDGVGEIEEVYKRIQFAIETLKKGAEEHAN